ncbi:MAG: hypothetical protein PHD58_04465 [Anaerolineales bacterium]|nr:hypothetical protein [Anaerolineales bacterium]
MLAGKKQVKRLLGELPLTAEMYWHLRQPGKPVARNFSLRRVENALPEWRAQVEKAFQENPPEPGEGKRILLFSMLRYWIEHATLLGMALAGLGHQPTLAFLPYPNWRKPANHFDLRRNNLYAKSALRPAAPLLKAVSFLDEGQDSREAFHKLPEGLRQAIEEVALRDAQYTLQIEEFDKDDANQEAGRLYQLRLERDSQAALAALSWMQANAPDVALIPNGSILEMGAVYRTARFLGVPVVTYEFGEQRKRIWLARDAEVMRQETSELWTARQGGSLASAQTELIRSLFTSRQRADLWQNFSRRWQGVPSQGGEQVRAELGLDGRPTALLAANVIGDSLTLGRQVFSRSMTEWLVKTVQYFAERPQAQLIVRVHPGERYTQGPSVASVVEAAVGRLPAHIHLIPAGAEVNTYDLMAVSDIGLVYTTTTGMEMAMSGLPVVIAGETHYRGKGFSLDPQSWELYYAALEGFLAGDERLRLSAEQVELAWKYAYLFFFEYPLPFPWHLHFWDELKTWPLDRVLAREGQALFGETFRLLAGERRDWTKENHPHELER